jgi:hypothetical protein
MAGRPSRPSGLPLADRLDPGDLAADVPSGVLKLAQLVLERSLNS